MIVHAYALCWNERRLLPYYFRHYDAVVDRYFIADDGSTDGSREYLERHPRVELIRFDHCDPDSIVLSAQRFYNEAWKPSRGAADWVVVSNVDEHADHANLGRYLQRSRDAGVTALTAIGYQMVATEFPATDLALRNVLRTGARFEPMDKLVIFSPDAIDDVNYAVGRHTAQPTGHTVEPERQELRLLHYKYLGLEYLVPRLKELGSRLGPVDDQLSFGHQYRWTEADVVAEFAAFADRAVDLPLEVGDAEWELASE